MIKIILMFLMMFSACKNAEPVIQNNTPQNAENETAQSQNGQANNLSADNDNEIEENIMYLHIGEQVLTATLADNSSVEALKELLAAGDITIDMSDYGGFEKVGSIGSNLPTNDVRITSEPGDLILYQGNSLVIFYAPNTWSYTRLGKINDVTQAELKDILGRGDVTITLSLSRD
jgi:hypothetical protein